MNGRYMNLKQFRAFILAGISAMLVVGVPVVARAQTAVCTTNNWSSVVGATELSAGVASATNRKYSGPCGLRVNLNGAESYVVDDNPLNEDVFNVRFYFFMNSVADDVVMFQAEDGTGAAVIKAYYDSVLDNIYVDFTVPGGATETVVASGLSTGWHSLEIQWASTGNPTVSLQQGETSTSQTWSNALDMSGVTIEAAKLGAIGTVPATGSIDFDDYDSRREGTPGRLMVGDADGNSIVAVGDLFAVHNERIGTAPANGQADCNEDGIVAVSDLFCVNTIRLGTSP